MDRMKDSAVIGLGKDQRSYGFNHAVIHASSGEVGKIVIAKTENSELFVSKVEKEIEKRGLPKKAEIVGVDVSSAEDLAELLRSREFNFGLVAITARGPDSVEGLKGLPPDYLEDGIHEVYARVVLERSKELLAAGLDPIQCFSEKNPTRRGKDFCLPSDLPLETYGLDLTMQPIVFAIQQPWLAKGYGVVVHDVDRVRNLRDDLLSAEKISVYWSGRPGADITSRLGIHALTMLDGAEISDVFYEADSSNPDNERFKMAVKYGDNSAQGSLNFLGGKSLRGFHFVKDGREQGYAIVSSGSRNALVPFLEGVDPLIVASLGKQALSDRELLCVDNPLKILTLASLRGDHMVGYDRAVEMQSRLNLLDQVQAALTR